MIGEVHPWNIPTAQTLMKRLAQLPHALLLSGPRGLGKNDMAAWLAQRLLCVDRSMATEPCGRCQNCELVAAGSHPDLHVLFPEAVYKNSESILARYARRYPVDGKGKESVAIRIDQIRALIDASQTRPQIAACKVMILSPADAMNVNASNSLLKLLEEPPPDSHMLLVSDRPALLPATIRSRCTRLEFRPPEREAAIDWLVRQAVSRDRIQPLLALAADAPLEAFMLAEHEFLAIRDTLVADLESLVNGAGEPTACASRWKQSGSARCLAWLQGWIGDLIRLQAAPGHPVLRNPDVPQRLQAMEKRLNLIQLFGMNDHVSRSRRQLTGGVDEQLLLEDVLVHFSELVQAG